MAVVLSEADDVIYADTFNTVFNVKAVFLIVFEEDVDFVHTTKQVV